MPGGQRLQAVHSLLLGCRGAVQAAGLDIHSGGSPGEHISMMHVGCCCADGVTWEKHMHMARSRACSFLAFPRLPFGATSGQ